MTGKKFFQYNKYKNKSCTCNVGHIHDSRGEARYCDELQLLKKAKEISDFEIQKTFSLKAYDKHITNHRVDFVIIKNDGSQEVHEFKGFATDVWKLKQKLFEANFPEIPYIVVHGMGN